MNEHKIRDHLIPLALKNERRWIRWDWRNGRKVPEGAWTDPSVWRTFDDAMDGGAGVGFVLGDGWCGIDLDDCRDPCIGELSDLAKDVVDTLQTYCEISPSEKGLKLLCGSTPPGQRTKGEGIEIYSQGRWFAITGNVIGDYAIADRPDELAKVYCRYVAPSPALAALLRIKPTRTENDGSRRLFTVACRAIEAGVSGQAAIMLIRQYAEHYPFPRNWSDGEIAQRLADAGERTQKVYATTDLGNGERFAAQHGGEVRYCHPWNKWLVWDGRRWAPDTTGEIMRRAKHTSRAIYDEAAKCEDSDQRTRLSKWATGSESCQRLEAMIKLAKNESPIPITVDALDADPWLLNCENGTIDLRTGKLREHRKSDFITKCCPVSYAPGEVPRWQEFIDRVLPPPLGDFMQRLMGASLVGEVRDHILPILYGVGANGKSVLIETWLGILGGDYAMKAPAGMLVIHGTRQHPTELADLHGKRLVAAVETEENARLAATLVKELTGGDTIRARRMREDFWQFRPSHMVVLATNHKPIVTATDDGIWRRLCLVPFAVTIPAAEQDKQLASKLRDEWSAILSWTVAGCLAWQQRGLAEPEPVAAATATYRADSDIVARFVEECLADDPNAKLTKSEAYQAYRAWAIANGEDEMNTKRFSTLLGKLYQTGAIRGIRHFKGVRLKPVQ